MTSCAWTWRSIAGVLAGGIAWFCLIFLRVFNRDLMVFHGFSGDFLFWARLRYLRICLRVLKQIQDWGKSGEVLSRRLLTKHVDLFE